MADVSKVQVGDVVAWDAVPSGVLVRDEQGEYAIKADDWAFWVGLMHQGVSAREARWYPATQERWNPAQVRGAVTIIALNVPADATADDLRALAERFEAEKRTPEDERRDVLAYIHKRAIEWDTAGLRPSRGVAIADLQAEIFVGRHVGAAEKGGAS